MKRGVKNPVLLAALLSIVLVTGCSFAFETGKALMETGSVRKKQNAVVLQASYGAADMLIQKTEERISPKTPLRVMVLANASWPGESTGFGVIVAEQVAARFSQLGYTVVTGEAPPSKVMIGGSYASARDAVLVHLAMTAADSGEILGAVDYTIPMTRDVRDMTKTAEQKRSVFDY